MTEAELTFFISGISLGLSLMFALMSLADLPGNRRNRRAALRTLRRIEATSDWRGALAGQGR